VQLAVWGFAQIAVGMFLSVLISKSRTATSTLLIACSFLVVGMLVSIWVTMFAIVINLVFYNLPRTLPLYYKLIPQFAFSRQVFLLATLCSKGRCY
jgi:hypothetical protein